MKKIGLLLMVLALCTIQSWAGIIWNEDTKTLTLESPFDMNDFNNNYSSQTAKTQRLVIIGNNPDWAQIRDKFKTGVLQEIDMTQMTINSNGTFYNWPGKDNAYGSITSLKLPNGLKEISTSAFEQLKELETVTIPNTVEVIGEKAFSDCVKLKNIVFEEVPSVHTFKSNCFQRCAFENFTFPTSIKLIETNAFNECKALKTMTFPKGISGLHIIGGNAEGGAFSNCVNITDIYIETTDKIDCDVNTYPWKVTYNQGDPNGTFATLHFPADQADYYTNLGHSLSISVASDPGKFHEWLMEHVKKANDHPQNGWWQFVNAGTNEDGGKPIPSGKFLKTFSDPNFAHIVPRGVKAYAITGINKESANGKPYFTVDMMVLDVIPRNTGVILFGEPNATAKDGSGKTLVMSVVTLDDGKGHIDGATLDDGTVIDLSLRRKNWENLASEHVMFKNYLEPSTLGEETSTQLQPYKVEDDGHAYRYFGFSHYRKSKTGKSDESDHGKGSKELYDYAGFFRCTNSTIGQGKAYLKLREDEYDDPEGGEVIIPLSCQNITYQDAKTKNNVTFYYKDEYKTDAGWQAWNDSSPYWHIAIWEDIDMFGVRDDLTAQPAFVSRFAGEVEITDNGDGTATMILPISATQEQRDGGYYTLQGVRVTNPTKGIYIQNGKKIVIK